MSIPETNQVGGNSRAKKRRRWSTNQEDALILNRFGSKGRILGRQATGISLSSFQSNSNPIFEPAPPAGPATSFGAGRFLGLRAPRNPALQRISGIGREAANLIATSLNNLPNSRHSNGGWPDEDEVEISSPLPMPRGSCAEVEDAGLNSSTLALAVRTCDVESSPECLRLPPPSPANTSSDGDRSIDCPRFSDDSQAYVRALEDCERRSREIVDKVQANAAAELAQMREYMTLLETLRSNLAKCSAESKQYSELHRDAVVQLLSARDECSNLALEKDEVTAEKKKVEQKLTVVVRERDAEVNMRRDLQAKVETVENERDSLVRKVEKMESECGALRDAVKTLQDERDLSLQVEETKLDNEDASPDLVASMAVASKLNAVEGHTEVSSQINAIELALSSTEFFDTDQLLQPSDELDEKEELARERDELQIAVRDAEQRAADAEKERDDVVLAVKSEWDAVKVALREDKQRLEQELNTMREKKEELEHELNSARIASQVEREEVQGQRAGIKKLQNERDAVAIAMREVLKKVEGERDALQIAMNEAMRKSGKEGVDAAMVPREEKKVVASKRDSTAMVEQQKRVLEIQLSDVRDANSDLQIQLLQGRDEYKKLESEREALIAALIVVRAENREYESELSTKRRGRGRVKLGSEMNEEGCSTLGAENKTPSPIQAFDRGGNEARSHANTAERR